MTAGLTRIIGIGQPIAGDDSVGITVARALSEQEKSAGVEIHEITDPARLIELLASCRRAILIDALVCSNSPGKVKCLTIEELAVEPVTPFSSHGIGITAAIGLARTLTPEANNCAIQIVGITINPPTRYTHALSAPVVSAIPRAADLATRMLISENP